MSPQTILSVHGIISTSLFRNTSIRIQFYGGTPSLTGGVLGTKKVLLCIDDEQVGLRVRKLILEKNGYQVLTAEEGEEGLAIFDREPVDAVVLDYFMPGMDGGAIAKAMKQKKPAVPIVLLSAFYSLPDGAVTAVDAFLTKGDSPEVLLTKINELLQK